MPDAEERDDREDDDSAISVEDRSANSCAFPNLLLLPQHVC